METTIHKYKSIFSALAALTPGESYSLEFSNAPAALRFKNRWNAIFQRLRIHAASPIPSPEVEPFIDLPSRIRISHKTKTTPNTITFTALKEESWKEVVNVHTSSPIPAWLNSFKDPQSFAKAFEITIMAPTLYSPCAHFIWEHNNPYQISPKHIPPFLAKFSAKLKFALTDETKIIPFHDEYDPAATGLTLLNVVALS